MDAKWRPQVKANGLFVQGPKPTGLVIVFPPGVTGLFNPRVHRLVTEVERKLDGVFVTYALSGGAGPDVRSAAKAARFAGCDSAVVVLSLEPSGGPERIDSSTDTLWAEEQTGADLRDAVDQLVVAYNLARADSGIAA